jgi:hypothetical protein
VTIFELGASVTVSAYTTVKAKNLEEAIAIAEKREVNLQSGPGDESHDEQWIINDADGAPVDIHEA